MPVSKLPKSDFYLYCSSTRLLSIISGVTLFSLSPLTFALQQMHPNASDDIGNIENVDNIEQKKTKQKSNISQYYQPKKDFQTPLKQSVYIQPADDVEQKNRTSDAKKATGQPNQQTINQTAFCDGEWIIPSQPKNPVKSKQAFVDKANADTETDATDKTIYATADSLYYSPNKTGVLSGDVHFTQADNQITANNLSIDLAKDTATASGGVTVSNDAIYSHTDSLTIDLKNNQSQINQAQFFSTELQSHGQAKHISQAQQGVIEMQDVQYTACPPNQKAWALTAKQLKLDDNTGRATAEGATLEVSGVPILYLPYMKFPIDDRRSTGILIPKFGFSNDGGFDVSLPYYLNLASNYDATLTPRWLIKRGVMLDSEFRYLSQYGNTEIDVGYLPYDKQRKQQNVADKSRKKIVATHDWQINKNLALFGVYNYVSDKDYLTELGSNPLIQDTLNLPRGLTLTYQKQFDSTETQSDTQSTQNISQTAQNTAQNYQGTHKFTNLLSKKLSKSLSKKLLNKKILSDNLFNDKATLEAQLKFETFQTVDKSTPDKDKPYARLPQLTVQYDKNQGMGLNTHLAMDLGYFVKRINDKSAIEDSGVRLYTDVGIGYHFAKPWGYIKPALSVKHISALYDDNSAYQQGLSTDDEHVSVTLPELSIEAQMVFDKYSQIHQQAVQQSLVPRLFYVYMPYENQNKLPNYDTKATSLSYDQLYNNQRFLGYDRLADTHALTLGLDYKLHDANGLERFNLGVANRYHFNDTQSNLAGIKTKINRSSGPIVRLQGALTPKIKLMTDVAIQNNNDTNFVISQLSWRPHDHTLVNLGFLNRQEILALDQQAIKQATASFIVPLDSNWQMMAHAQYDFINKTAIDSLIGATYESCCYRFAVYARNYYNDLDKPNIDPKRNQFWLEISMKGLASFSGNLSKLLEQKVMGYHSTYTGLEY